MPQLIRRDDADSSGQFQAFSGFVNYGSLPHQLALSILVPQGAPTLVVTIPWITNVAAGFIPGLPKLYVAAGEALNAAQTNIDGSLTEVAPTSVDSQTPGLLVARYVLSAALTRPYAGVGADALTSGLLLRTNVHKGAGAGAFPVYLADDWVMLPPANNTGELGVTVGNTTGPITVESLVPVLNALPGPARTYFP